MTAEEQLEYDNKRGACYHCHKKGHTAYNCRKRLAEVSQSESQESDTKDKGEGQGKPVVPAPSNYAFVAQDDIVVVDDMEDVGPPSKKQAAPPAPGGRRAKSKPIPTLFFCKHDK